MLRDGKIQIGTGVNGPVFLLPFMANRHGLIAGATGTGKTVTLKVLAEGFSEMGVPVFLSDIKSDLSGMVKPGTRTESMDRRLQKCGLDPEEFDYHAFPSAFWDVYGKNGNPIQATVQGMGSQLLGRMLGLNETQTGVLNILFRYCAQYDYPLLTLEDLKKQLVRMGENTQYFTLNYGNVSVASVGAIQRAVAMLEDEGGASFFGTEEFQVLRWLVRDENDRGMINILSADELFAHPLMYSTFLLWMLTRLYESLPERGDADRPVAVFFFDEAHLLFDDCSRVLMDKIEQVVRLIRSKGVGVYFITQSPADIPMSILGQLGNRVQHALRAYTPLDQKAVKVAAQTFRTNPDFQTEEAITTLKTGEALISCLDEDGAPGVVQRATVLPPQSHLGALSEAERARAVRGLPLEDALAAPGKELPPLPQSEGVGTTLIVTAMALVLGVILGLIVALVRTAHDQQRPGRRNIVLGVVNAICKFYTTVIRGTPMMVQLLIMGMVVFASSRNFTAVGALTLGINSGAYVSEIIRSGLMSIDAGQMEAGRSLGMDYFTTMRFIIIPQAIKNILPALGNEFIILLKDTSLITVIGGKELLYAAQGVMNRTYEAMFPLMGTACIYLALVMLFTALLGKLERRLRQSDLR